MRGRNFLVSKEQQFETRNYVWRENVLKSRYCHLQWLWSPVPKSVTYLPVWYFPFAIQFTQVAPRKSRRLKNPPMSQKGALKCDVFARTFKIQHAWNSFALRPSIVEALDCCDTVFNWIRSGCQGSGGRLLLLTKWDGTVLPISRLEVAPRVCVIRRPKFRQKYIWSVFVIPAKIVVPSSVFHNIVTDWILSLVTLCPFHAGLPLKSVPLLFC